MSLETWIDDCEKMCSYLQSDIHLYNFFMNSDRNHKNKEFIKNFKVIKNKEWRINDEKYLLLCLQLSINEINRVISRI